MKQKIYLSICLLSIGILTACGKKNSPPTAVVTPTPTPIVTPVAPSPVAIEPTPTPTPTVTPTPTPSVGVTKVKPTPQVTPKTTISELPTSLYPQPTPIAIPVPVETVPPKIAIKANPKPEPLSPLKTTTDPNRQITPVGIGAAKIGMTFGDLKSQMGTGYDFPVKTNFLEGFDAIAVTKGRTVQYYIPYPAGTNFGDADRIQHLMTDNPSYRTQQGVGPGTPIKQAATVYGGATLTLSKENESHEFINFNQQPSGLAFRPKPIGKRAFAGNYPESDDEYLKTQKYDNRAAIGQITVSCPEEQCAQESQ
jgi:hypothetical protein